MDYPRRDWTPAVLLTATACLVVVLMVWFVSPRLRGLYDADPGPQHDRRLAPPEVSAWAGDVVPGVKGVLAPVWGDPGPDRFHDEQLNEQLGLPRESGLAFYRLLLFNTGSEEKEVSLDDGALAIEAGGVGGPVLLRSLAGMSSRGEVKIAAGPKAVLGSLGALRESVTIPAGSVANLLVAFRTRVDLAKATRISTRDGQDLHRRPMARAELQDLLYDPPDPRRVRDL